jgi:hypothetical protein
MSVFFNTVMSLLIKHEAMGSYWGRGIYIQKFLTRHEMEMSDQLPPKSFCPYRPSAWSLRGTQREH